MRYAHRKNIIHRDLKPSNVIMQKQGDTWIKILDFKDWLFKTMAIILPKQEPMGTPGYMSPEQIRDAKNVNQTISLHLDVFILAGAQHFREKIMN